MELYERIRKEHREGVSIRSLADRHGVHRRSVREAVGASTPPSRKTPDRESPALGPWKTTIRGWLEADVAGKVPRKQRHTARRVWQRLADEHDAQVSESAVRGFVAEVKAELATVAITRHPSRALGRPVTGRPGARGPKGGGAGDGSNPRED